MAYVLPSQLNRRVDMRMFTDDLGVTVPVEWYEVPRTNPPFPYPTVFGNRDWIRPPDENLLGEVPGTKTFYRANVGDEYGGTGLCGTQDQWRYGCSILDEPAKRDPDSGVACCCGVIPKQLDAAPVVGWGFEPFPVAYTFPMTGGGAVDPFTFQDCCDALAQNWELPLFSATSTTIRYQAQIQCTQNDKPFFLLIIPVLDLVRLAVSISTPAPNAGTTAIWQAALSSVNIFEKFTLPKTQGHLICENFPPEEVTLSPVWK